MKSGQEAQSQRAPGPWLGCLLLPNLSQVTLTPTRALRPLPQVLGVGDSGSAHLMDRPSSLGPKGSQQSAQE